MTGPISFDDRYNEPDQLRDQLRQLLRYRSVIALGIVLGLLVGVLLALFRADHYTSTGEVVVRSTADPFSSISVSIDHQLSMATERQVALSATVAARAASSLGEPADAAGLQRDLRVSNPPDTQVLRFEYTADTPGQAARGTNAFVEAYLADRKERTDAMVRRMTTALEEQVAALTKQIESKTGAARSSAQSQIASLQKRISDLKTRDTTGGDIVRKGEVPAQPSGPGLVVLIGLGLLGGLTLGILLAWLRSVLEPRVRSVTDTQGSLGAPVLGILSGAQEGDELLAVTRSNSALTETYRTLAFRLTHDERSCGRSSLMVLAPREHPNAAAVAANLCAAIAETGHDVLLVDATTGTPALATRLPLLADSADGEEPSAPGEAEAGQGGSRADGVIVDAGRAGAGRFTLLPGSRQSDTAGSPTPPVVNHILASTDPATSVVVLTRALLEHADGLAVAQRVDGILVVAGLNHTRRDDLRRVRELISCTGGRIVGAVLDTDARRGRLRNALDGGRLRRKHRRTPATSSSPDAAAADVRPTAEHHGEGPHKETIPQPDAVSSGAQDESLTASQG